jgi:hypothetical protein
MRIINSFSDIAAGSTVYIFGTGEGGVALHAALLRFGGFNFGGFIDNYRSGDFLGAPVMNVGTFLRRRSPGCCVLLSGAGFSDMAELLEQDGCRDAVNAWPFALRLIAADRAASSSGRPS